MARHTEQEAQAWAEARKHGHVVGMRRADDGSMLFGYKGADARFYVRLSPELSDAITQGYASVPSDSAAYLNAEFVFSKRITLEMWLKRRDRDMLYPSVRADLSRMLGKSLSAGGGATNMKAFDLEVRKYFAKSFGASADGVNLSVEFDRDYLQTYYVDGD